MRARTPGTPLLARRALNRATLDRQFLLRRTDMAPLELVEHLVGLQSQTPHTWYVGFWSRLIDCSPAAVAELLSSRKLVRIALMRSTIHLVTAADALALRPLVDPVIERSMNGNFGRHLGGIDRGELIAAGRAVLDEQPRTFSELGRELEKQWPGRDPASLAQAIRAWVPLVQVTPRGVWGASGKSAHATIETWLGTGTRPAYPADVPPNSGRLTADLAPLGPLAADDLVLRYLGAFGPASVRDAQTWSGLTRLGEVFERLRPRLVTFTDDNGVELYDLPDAPRPDPDIPAPARFLYDYDNLLLSHADRSRVITEDYFRQNFDVQGPMPRIILLDGVTAGTWTMTTGRGTATLTVRPFGKLSATDEDALQAEGASLLRFVAANASTHDIVFAR